MIDRSERDKLGDLIGRYLQGEASYSELWNGAFEVCGSEDRAVDIIGVSLAPDLRGMDDATLQRCRAFLATDLEYGWPKIIFSPPKDYTIYGLLVTFVATVGSLLLLRRPANWPALIFVGGIAASVMIWLSKFVLRPRHIEAEKRRHRNEGRDFGVWPFLSRSELPSHDDEIAKAYKR